MGTPRDKASLKAELAKFGLELISAEVGRSPVDGLTWHVTVQHRLFPRAGICSYHADFPAGTDMYAPTTIAALIRRIILKREMP